jgi:hypothetical protein
MTAYLGQGATVTFGGTAIAQLLSIDGPNLERTMVDTTNLGTTTLRTFLPGFGDGGEVSLEVQYEHVTGQAGVFDAFDQNSATPTAIVITFSDNDTYSFNAFVRSISHSQSMDEVNRSTIVLKVTGDITHTAVA